MTDSRLCGQPTAGGATCLYPAGGCPLHDDMTKRSPVPDEKQRAVHEAVLLGCLGVGIPPRDREDWEWLEETVDNATLAMLYRWYPYYWYEDIMLDIAPNYLAFGYEEASYQFLRERKAWGERHPGWADDDIWLEPPPWRTRIPSRYDPRVRPGREPMMSGTESVHEPSGLLLRCPSCLASLPAGLLTG